MRWFRIVLLAGILAAGCATPKEREIDYHYDPGTRTYVKGPPLTAGDLLNGFLNGLANAR